MSAKDDGGPAFTPGPWIVSHDPDGSPDDYCIGVPDGKVDQIAVCSKRDAALIAAAPDMYEALRVARIYVSDVVVVCKAENLDFAEFEKDLAQIDAALAKAGIKERAK